MSIEAFNNIALFNNIVFNSYDFQYFGGQKLDNQNFYVFGVFFSLIELLKVKLNYIGYIWYAGIFMLGAFGINELIEFVASKNKFLLQSTNKKAIILFYLFNYYTITQLDNGYLIFPYLVMPGLIVACLKYSEKPCKKYLFILIILANLNTTQITLNIINLLILFVIVLNYEGIIKAIKSLAIIVGCSLWFWGSYVITAIAPSKGTIFAAKDEGFEFYNRTTEFFEVVRLLGNWAVSDNVVPVAKMIGDNPVGIVISFIPLIILIFLSIERNIKFKYAIVLFLLLAMGSNFSSPLYFIWNFISNNLTLFNVFRNTYKFVGPIVLLIAINFIFIKELKLIRLMYIYIFYTILVIYIVNIHPLNTRFYGTPQYWSEVEGYIINNINPKDSILLLPFEKNTIFKWGSYNGYYYGSPLNIKNPILYRTLSSTNNALVENIREKFIQNNPCDILKNNNIKLIINRNDMMSSEYFSIRDIKCGVDYKKFGPIELIYIK